MGTGNISFQRYMLALRLLLWLGESYCGLAHTHLCLQTYSSSLKLLVQLVTGSVQVNLVSWYLLTVVTKQLNTFCGQFWRENPAVWNFVTHDTLHPRSFSCWYIAVVCDVLAWHLPPLTMHNTAAVVTPQLHLFRVDIANYQPSDCHRAHNRDLKPAS